ncbi:hypothetical protein Dimus_011898 [Dionaea muscipula]
MRMFRASPFFMESRGILQNIGTRMRLGYFIDCRSFNAHLVLNSQRRLSVIPLTETDTHPTDFAPIQNHIQRYRAIPISGDKNPDPKLVNFIDKLEDESAIETLHARLIKNGSIKDLDVGNYVLNSYVKFKLFRDARNLFDEMLHRDVRTWTILISGYARTRSAELGLRSFARMLVEEVTPNQFTLSSVFKCCSTRLRVGRVVHGWILINGVSLDVVLENSILDFYMKCGELSCARRIFELMGVKNTTTWNIVIGGYIQNGDMENSLALFRRLPSKDVETWNTIISGLIHNGSGRMALELLYEMAKVEVRFTEYTFSMALAVISSLMVLELGRQIHARVMRLELYNNEFVRSSLIDMYSKCNNVDKATTVFRQMPDSVFRKEKSWMDTVCWSAMVSGYVQNGKWMDAVGIFCKMVSEGIKVDKFTMTSVVCSCADYGTLEFGQQVHSLVLKSGHKLDVALCSSLVYMYSKCGSFSDAYLMFNQLNNRNVFLWTSIICACALHGRGREAIQLFELMRSEAIPPNEVTFLGILTACSHAGLVDEGCKYFKQMKVVYCIKPIPEHYTSMVDLFGRAGRLDDIKNFILENNISHLSSVWSAFLSSCRFHKNVDLGKRIAARLLELEPLDPQPYVLLSNISTAGSQWEESARLRSLMEERGVKKQPAQSWILLNGKIHTFAMGHKLVYPQEAEIYSYLDKLVCGLKEIG